ncbi:unnamed protein product [Lathyrus oleraceus]|uniref:Uncharacterized protein n=1 Tax=Pisum sativum TaxID=3888 RepID=A0A9D5BNA3_PEA|nr:hypothetical protein KIW84_014409 [Pisum sativum]
MGNTHNTNLRKSCTSFEGTSTATRACFGDSFRVDMIHQKKKKNSEFWNAVYEIGEKLETDVDLLLQANHDNRNVEKMSFGLYNDKTDFIVNITRVSDDGLQGGITAIKSSGALSTFVNDEQDYSSETTFVSCDSSNREGLFVLQMKKMKHSNIAFKVAMAHYYVTKTVGLYVEATICCNKGRGFMVEVNGPFIYQSVDLRKIIDEIRLTGIWSPGGKPSTETNGESSSSLHGDNVVVGQIVKNASNKGLINANGCTNGSLNNVIFCTIM